VAGFDKRRENVKAMFEAEEIIKKTSLEILKYQFL
jgi:hypothetical protein